MEIKNRNLKLKMENENENRYSIWDLDLGNQIGEINFKFENRNRILNLEFMTIYKVSARKPMVFRPWNEWR